MKRAALYAMHFNLGRLEDNTVYASYARTVKTWVYRKSETFVKNYVNLDSNSNSVYQLCDLGAMPSPL